MVACRNSAMFALSMLGLAATANAGGIPTNEADFTRHVAEALRHEIGEASVAVNGPLALGVGDLNASLDRIYNYCRATPAGCASEVDAYIKGAADTHRDRSPAIARESIRIVVRTTQYLDPAQRTLTTGVLQARPLAGDLIVVNAFDTPSAIRVLGEKESSALWMSADDVHAIGRENTSKALAPLANVTKPIGKGRIGQIAANPYNPSRLAFHDTWAELAKAHKGKLIVAVPTTDSVLYIGEDSRVAIEALRTQVNDIAAKAPNRLSTALLRWKPAGWEVLK